MGHAGVGFKSEPRDPCNGIWVIPEHYDKKDDVDEANMANYPMKILTDLKRRGPFRAGGCFKCGYVHATNSASLYASSIGNSRNQVTLDFGTPPCQLRGLCLCRQSRHGPRQRGAEPF